MRMMIEIMNKKNCHLDIVLKQNMKIGEKDDIHLMIDHGIIEDHLEEIDSYYYCCKL